MQTKRRNPKILIKVNRKSPETFVCIQISEESVEHTGLQTFRPWNIPCRELDQLVQI